jgi:hypothetical protein
MTRNTWKDQKALKRFLRTKSKILENYRDYVTYLTLLKIVLVAEICHVDYFPMKFWIYILVHR